MKKDKDSPDTKYQILNTFLSGQSLVEVMVAVAILVLVLTALVLGTTLAIRNANFAQNQARATKYTQEGIERVRAYRDQNDWDVFKAKCLAKSISLGSIDPAFVRVIEECVEEASQKVRVTITVSWQEASRVHQSELTSYFTKWQQ